MLKDLFQKGKCLAGFHEGEWTLQAQDRCLFIQVCRHCGAVNQRTEHAWPDWQRLADDQCDEIRLCNRCAQQESRIEHCWSQPDYFVEGSCELAQQCERCGMRNEETTVSHQWDAWRYEEVYRSPVRFCRRCAGWMPYFADMADRRQIDEIETRSDTADAEPAAGTEPDLERHADLMDVAAGSAARSREESGQTSGLDGFKERMVAAMTQGADSASVFSILEEAFAAEAKAGRFTPARLALHKSLMSELKELLNQPAGTMADQMAKLTRSRELMGRLTEALVDPSRAEPVKAPDARSRAGVVLELYKTLHKYVFSEIAKSGYAEQEQAKAQSFLPRCQEIRDTLIQLETDEQVLGLERETLRPLAMEVRHFSLRNHLTLARPIWPTQTTPRDANAIFYSGGEILARSLGDVCRARGLHLLLPRPHHEPAALRWQQISQCHLAVFDVTAYWPALSGDALVVVAGVTYELGVALAAGRPVILLAGMEQKIPFDLDIEPLRLTGGPEDVKQLGQALDETLYGLQRGSRDSSVDKTVHYLQRVYGEHANSNVRISVQQLAGDVIKDSVKVRDVTTATVAFLGAEAPLLLYPSWPGDYPELHSRRCFHVCAFGPEWAAATMRIIAEACNPSIEYVRGDQVLMPDVIRSIWNEICQASHIVVDLTGFNANAVLELGMANTLGRNVLIVTQDERPENSFRAIAKQRMHRYSLKDEAGVQAFRQTLARFLA